MSKRINRQVVNAVDITSDILIVAWIVYGLSLTPELYIKSVMAFLIIFLKKNILGGDFNGNI